MKYVKYMNKQQLFELSKAHNQDILAIIDKYGLDRPNRIRDKLYKRYYLMNELRNRHNTMEVIGMYFNLNHSSAVVGIPKHKFWWKIKDEIYLKAVWPLIDQVEKREIKVNYFTVDLVSLDNGDFNIQLSGRITSENTSKFNNIMSSEEISKAFVTM